MRRLCLALVPYLLFAAAAARAAEPTIVWKLARGPEGGLVFDLAVDPRDADVVFARGAWTLLVTRNGGASWELVPGPGEGDPPGALRLDASGRELRVQTGTGWFSSSDAGHSWRPAPAPDTDPEVPLRVTTSQSLFGALLHGSPADTRRIYAMSDEGLKVSRDRGETFAPGAAAPGQNNSAFDRLLPDPRDANALVMATGAGIFRSEDSGASWQPATGLPPAPHAHWSKLLTDPSSPDGRYVASTTALFHSADAGRSWVRVGTAPDNTVHSLAIAPQAPHRIYASSRQGLFRSDDGGRAWRTINSGASIGYFNALAADPAAPLSVYASSLDRLYHSADGGASWQPVETGARDTGFGAITFDPRAPQVVYVGSGRGMYRSVDGGRTWARFGAPALRAVAPDPRSRDTLYAIDQNDMPLVSHDDGANWKPAPRLPVDRAMELSDALQLGRAPFQFVDIATGESFFRDRFPGHPRDSGMGHRPLTGAMAPSDKRFRYLAWVGGSVSRTEDGGATWTTSVAFPDRHVDALAVHPKNPRCVFAATTRGSVWLSVDGARTWRDIGEGVRNLPVAAILILPTQPCTALLATRGAGIWRAELPALP